MRTLQELRSILAMIQRDTENDISTMDGKPFTGRVVAEGFGNQGAAIVALAGIVAELTQRMEPAPIDNPSPK